ncbi:MAG TPA: SDR family oxidoreductase [Candidatus Limnocylindrales bacterium]|nr:SDR family oxidoreductase [Candidatus Limnocylindrales bacterium]
MIHATEGRVRTPLDELVERSRRIGADASLVVNGGGNTSAKGLVTDALGRSRRTLWVKGSGADLATSGGDAYPALWLDELLTLRDRTAVDDAEMVRLVRAAMVDGTARRPSIETLLHAFVPAAHVDHVHADAICALTNQPHGPEAVREALGERFGYVDWIRPGFQLARIVADLAAYDGVVLAHHGLVTWDDDSEACLARTLDAVRRADELLSARVAAAAARADSPSPAGPVPDLTTDELETLLLLLRGALSKTGRRVLHADRRLRGVADRADVAELAAAGVPTGDHMLWMKPWPAVVSAPAPEAVTAAVDAYESRYRGYFGANQHLREDDTPMHDPAPRVALVPGLGAVVAGASIEDARRCAEVAYHAQTTLARAKDAFGTLEPLPDTETFRFDYWPMELYKLTLADPLRPFAGTVQVVTGAASGIGRTIALELAKAGASVVAADLDGPLLETLAAEALDAGAPEPAWVAGDQSDEAVVIETVRTAVTRFGGLDGVVINAGIGIASPLEDLELARWERGLAVNLTSAFLLTRESLKRMRTQGLGGSIVYIASKNAFAPGAGFGGYSVTKAGMLQLMRIAALEGGPIGVRTNAVNPDAVFDNSRLWGDGLREQRAAEHGIRPEELEDFYAKRNLLHRHVTTKDVANAVMFLLSEASSRTTGAVIPVDGGVAAAFPR